mmetsp:Transcript_12678/g.29262  ORF Transcript_12678/g.29262 Transcript_12678/m.29262 type:complete len:85 (-) Transcript_12678:948-1202(-)
MRRVQRLTQGQTPEHVCKKDKAAYHRTTRRGRAQDLRRKQGPPAKYPDPKQAASTYPTLQHKGPAGADGTSNPSKDAVDGHFGL